MKTSAVKQFDNSISGFTCIFFYFKIYLHLRRLTLETEGLLFHLHLHLLEMSLVSTKDCFIGKVENDENLDICLDGSHLLPLLPQLPLQLEQLLQLVAE